MKIAAKAMVAAALVFAGGVSSCAYMNVTGFCYGQRRYLTDRELVEKAILYNLANPHSAPDLIAYAGLEDFHKFNPNCCTVHHEGHYTVEDSRLYRFLGWYETVVEVWYRRRESGLEPYYRSFVALDACGRVVNRLGPDERSAPPAK